MTNSVYSHALAKTLARPMLLSAPKFVLEAALGREMADELLLSSQRVLPKALLEAGYHFRFSSLEGALASLVRA